MKNMYRVDRSTSDSIVPCGMTNMLYVGDNPRIAKAIFDNAHVGLDGWDQPNMLYGVIFAVWNEAKKDYVVKRSKGFTLAIRQDYSMD